MHSKGKKAETVVQAQVKALTDRGKTATREVAVKTVCQIQAMAVTAETAEAAVDLVTIKAVMPAVDQAVEVAMEVQV